MAVKIRYTDDGKGVEVVFSGFVTSKEFYEVNEKIYAEGALQKYLYQIADLTEATRSDVSISELANMAAQDAAATLVNPDMIIAVIAPGDLAYGMSRMWQAYAENAGVRSAIFRDRASAEAWIAETLEGGPRDTRPGHPEGHIPPQPSGGAAAPGS